MSSEEIEAVVNRLGQTEKGKIQYSEYIAATLDIPKYLTEEKLDALFSTFDT